jgi:hypothetical protein
MSLSGPEAGSLRGLVPDFTLALSYPHLPQVLPGRRGSSDVNASGHHPSVGLMMTRIGFLNRGAGTVRFCSAGRSRLRFNCPGSQNLAAVPLRHDVLVEAKDIVGIIGTLQTHEPFVFGIAID